MDRLEEVKKYVEYRAGATPDKIRWLISEVERLRTVEQAYHALLSATAGQQK